MNKIGKEIIGYWIGAAMGIVLTAFTYNQTINCLEFNNPTNIEHRKLKKVQNSLKIKVNAYNNKFEEISTLYEKGTITDSTLEKTVAELKNTEANYLIASQKLKSFEKSKEYQRAQDDKEPIKGPFIPIVIFPPLMYLGIKKILSDNKKEDKK